MFFIPSIDVKTFCGLQTIETIAAIVNSISGHNILSLGHKDGCRGVVDGHKDELAILQGVDLNAEVSLICCGEGSLNNSDGSIQVSLELLIDTVGVGIVGLVEYADGLAGEVLVDEVSCRRMRRGSGRTHCRHWTGS